MVARFLASACIIGLLAGSASAAPLQFTISGIVYNSMDNLGVFGPAGDSLVGQQFTATYLFDPALRSPIIQTATEFQNSSSWWSMGPSIGLGASLTINGHTVHVGGQYSSEVHARESAGSSLLYLAQWDYDYNSHIQTVMETSIGDAFDIGYGSPTFGPWSGNVMPMNSFTSWRLSDESGFIEWVSMDARHVTIGVPSPAPEPASWALLVGGFGLTGYALRARRRSGNARYRPD